MAPNGTMKRHVARCSTRMLWTLNSTLVPVPGIAMVRKMQTILKATFALFVIEVGGSCSIFARTRPT